MKARAVRGLSIGFRAIKDNVTDGIRHLRQVRLFEGSVCTLPMNPEAQITSVKEQPKTDTEVLEAFRNAARDIRSFHSRLIDGD